jgi:hypothetical protein
MVIFGYNKEVIRDLKAEIYALNQRVETLNDRIKSLKGYVYAKKVHLDIDPEEISIENTEESSKHLNTGFPLRPL